MVELEQSSRRNSGSELNCLNLPNDTPTREQLKQLIEQKLVGDSRLLEKLKLKWNFSTFTQKIDQFPENTYQRQDAIDDFVKFLDQEGKGVKNFTRCQGVNIDTAEKAQALFRLFLEKKYTNSPR